MLLGCSEDELHLLGGGKKQLSDYRGNWLLINYWASWCKPCIHEIPELNLLDAEPHIQVLGYNFDHLKGESLQAELQRFAIGYPSLIAEPSAIFEQAVPGGLPATMLIDPDGQFRSWLMGPQTKASVMAAIETLD
jgi:thiol-disulfide isomerase/thioredoxin